MIDLADGRPKRRYCNGVTIRLYPCSGCQKKLVTKRGGLCKKCAARKRERDYIIQGIRHPANRAFTGTTKAFQARKRRNGGCPAHWMIDEKEFGRCLKFKPLTLRCRDTGLHCPHKGVRDFAALQERLAHRFNFLESCAKGGVKSGRLRGGKRGRPRKIREALTLRG